MEEVNAIGIFFKYLSGENLEKFLPTGTDPVKLL